MSSDERDAPDWRPGASIASLRVRAAILARIRAFFAARGVLEVETPVLAAHGVSDPHLHGLETRYTGPGAPSGRRLFLQTSPEYAMKRLLAAGSGSIYQIARAFRDGEAGRLHNPEFTLLEWYRTGYDHHALMDEVEDLVRDLLGLGPARFARLGYAAAFRPLGIDPHHAGTGTLAACAAAHGIEAPPGLDRDGWFDLLLTHLIEPQLGRDTPAFIHDYPPGQAALARVRAGDPPLAERFELYYRGIELANGYHELGDAGEQRARFARDNAARRAAGLPERAPDERLLAALAHGLPPCAGVALGVDRLVMLAAGADSLDGVLAFGIDRS